jgi:hypothetical protein
MASTSTPSSSPSSTLPTPSFKEHLSYPSDIDPEPTSGRQQPQQPRQVLKDRLYIGNLHPTVDESVPLPLHPSNLIIPLKKVLTPSSLFKVRQSFQARFPLPQDWAPQRQAPRVCLHRVRKQRRKCPSPSISPSTSFLRDACFEDSITHPGFSFSRHASHESPVLEICRRCSTIARDPNPRHTTTTRAFMSGEKKEEADHIALNVGCNEGFNTGP